MYDEDLPQEAVDQPSEMRMTATIRRLLRPKASTDAI